MEKPKNIKDYDEWKLWNPQDDEEIYCLCEYCDGEIYVGEEYFEVDGDNIHEYCFGDSGARESQNIIRRIAGDD